MSFFTTFVNSLYNVNWLREQKDQKKHAWGYFFLLVFLVAVAETAYLAVVVPPFVHDARKAIDQQVPNFTAIIKNHELSVTGVEQPYIFEKEYDGSSVKVYVDTVTDTPPTMADLTNDKTQLIFLLTKKSVLMYDAGKHSTRDYDLKDAPDNGPLTKQMVMDGIDQFWTKAKYPLSATALFAIFLFSVIGKLIYILIYSLIFFLITSVTKRAWTFTQIFTLGLMAITASSVLGVVVFVGRTSIPFLYTAVFVSIMLTALFNKGKEQPPVVPTPPVPPAK